MSHKGGKIADQKRTQKKQGGLGERVSTIYTRGSGSESCTTQWNSNRLSRWNKKKKRRGWVA